MQLKKWEYKIRLEPKYNRWQAYVLRHDDGVWRGVVLYDKGLRGTQRAESAKDAELWAIGYVKKMGVVV